ncbi:MAG: hypothetical protein II670_04805 [Alphaproteobacteria bacterium]|nr:hypothetical protein [Alphaproteobacteria bacterium]
MCFYKDHSEHKISDKDIVCYKVVHADPTSTDSVFTECCSRVMKFPYKVGETYISDGFTLSELDVKGQLHGGVFHSYTRISNEHLEGLAARNEFWWYQRSVINEFLCIMECVIPAGTPYWENLNCLEYASMSIKVLRIMNPIEVLNDEEVLG